MFGIRLMFLLAVMGGVIAFIADKLGSKIGKKKLTVFGLRPHDTSVLLTVLSGVLISLLSIGILAVSSESARTALFGMEKLQKELLEGGYPADTPAAVVYKATWPDERILRCTVGTLDRTVKGAGLTKTSLIIVGGCMGDEYMRSLLYHPEFTTEFRKAKE